MIDVDVSELTKDYAVINGETIMFDEPFDETPTKADFAKWLTNITNVFRRLTDELESMNVIESKGDSRKV
jgi:hypothetical protein